MKEYILTTFSKPVPGLEEDYNRWYDEIHIVQLLEIPGINAAQRFKPRVGLNTTDSPYLTIYDIKVEAIEALMQLMQEKGKDMDISPSLDLTSVTTQVYEVMGDKTVKSIRQN